MARVSVCPHTVGRISSGLGGCGKDKILPVVWKLVLELLRGQDTHRKDERVGFKAGYLGRQEKLRRLEASGTGKPESSAEAWEKMWK